MDLFTPVIIGLHLASVHIPARDYQENFNPGIYVVTKTDSVFGVYRNTLDRTSFYFGQNFHKGPFTLTVGATTGYRIKGQYGFSKGPLALMLAPSVQLPEVFGLTPRVSYIPKIGRSNGSSVLHLSIEKEL